MARQWMMKQQQRVISGMARRTKTSCAVAVDERARDPTFDKYMHKYKNMLKVVAIQDLIVAGGRDGSVSVDFLERLSQRLRLNRGAASFLRRFPRIFRLSPSAAGGGDRDLRCSLAGPALAAFRRESAALAAAVPAAVERLERVVCMSPSRAVPLRALFKVWRELGLPDDFEDSVIARNPQIFRLFDAKEPGTHLLKLVRDKAHYESGGFTAAVERWRMEECCKSKAGVDCSGMRFGFKHGYPPGMKLDPEFRAKVDRWQRLRYVGPYEAAPAEKRRRAAPETVFPAEEKRAVAVVHEFVSLTVEKMIEVEKISHFGKWFGIEMNIRDLFLDHPGIFYLCTKGKRHTIFLREAFYRDRLARRDPVYDARMELFHLVLMGRRGSVNPTRFRPAESEREDED